MFLYQLHPQPWRYFCFVVLCFVLVLFLWSCWTCNWPLSYWVSPPINKERTESPPISIIVIITAIITIIIANCLLGHTHNESMIMFIQYLTSWSVHTRARRSIFAILCAAAAGCVTKYLRAVRATLWKCWLQCQHGKVVLGRQLHAGSYVEIGVSKVNITFTKSVS